MSARAAWRLESLGFARVYRYAAGKVDWFGAGMPREGRLAAVPCAADVVRKDIVTCRPDERIGGSSTELAQRQVYCAGQVLIGVFLCWQHLDQLRLLVVYQTLDFVAIDFSRHQSVRKLYPQVQGQAAAFAVRVILKLAPSLPSADVVTSGRTVRRPALGASSIHPHTRTLFGHSDTDRITRVNYQWYRD